MSAAAAPVQVAKPKPSATTQRRAAPSSGGSVHDSLLSGGQPLPIGLRRLLEPRFSADFGQVRLLAHELSHTVQQRGAGLSTGGPFAIGAAGSSHEREAAAAADAVIAGRKLTSNFSAVPAALIQREPSEADLAAVRDSQCRIFFKKGTTGFIDAKQFARCLALVKDSMTMDPQPDIALWGFASEEGPPDFNQKLSRDRANN